MRWLLLLLLLAQPQDAPDPIAKASDSIHTDKIKEHVVFLASDDLEGREAGYPGGQKAADYIARQAEAIGLKPLGDAAESGKRSWFQKFSPDRAKKLSTQNVIGWIEGSDSKLKAECIVIGAHYDHLGTAKQENDVGRVGKPVEGDDIWNGADDNASGAGALLEIARGLVELKGKLKRSVVVIWFSAEEWGLLGASYYVIHTPEEFPLDRTAAMLNMDMIGRNPDKPCAVSGTGTCANWETLLDEAQAATGAKFAYGKQVEGGSDHAVFSRNKIPAVHFFTGFHANYHRVSDHADLIAYDNVGRIARSVLRVGAALANLPERPAWRDPPIPKRGPQGRRLGVRLGPDLSDDEAKAAGLAEDEGGVKVDSVVPGDVADKAGVKGGDVILEMNGVKLSRSGTQDKLREILQQVKDGVEVPIKVLRAGEKVDLKAMWGAKSGSGKKDDEY